MTENLLEKKKLLQEVYIKAEKDSSESSITGIFKYLAVILLNEFKYPLSYKTSQGYYEAIVNRGENKKIKPAVLNVLSKYLGYESFVHFKEQEKDLKVETPDGSSTIGVRVGKHEKFFTDTISNIIIEITNSPVFNVPQIAKNGAGVGVLILTLVAGMAYKGMFKKNECMYWDGNQYQTTSCDDRNPKHILLPIDTVKLKYFKKITRPDTLTIENAFGNSWYSKSDNIVEFFTMDGVDPDNGKDLENASKYMLTKYAGDSAKKYMNVQYR